MSQIEPALARQQKLAAHRRHGVVDLHRHRRTHTGQHLSRHDVEQRPFYEMLGVALRGATQTIGADSVDGADAKLLGVPAASPVLRCERITTDTQGRPVLMSEHVFPARRTEFVVELPTAEPSVLPTGLRLVE